MLGKKQSLKVLLRVLKAEGVRHITTTVFQGQGLGHGLGTGHGPTQGEEDENDCDDCDEEKGEAQGPGLNSGNRVSGDGGGGGGGGQGRTRRWGLAWSFLQTPFDCNNCHVNSELTFLNGATNQHPQARGQAHRPPSKTAPQPNNRRMRRALAAATQGLAQGQAQDPGLAQGPGSATAQGQAIGSAQGPGLEEGQVLEQEHQST